MARDVSNREEAAGDETAETVDSLVRGSGSVYLPAGARVDRYVILDVIGQGGMGVVYKAHDPELDRSIALKLHRLHVEDVGDLSRARARLLREAQALAKLAHPNVVAAYDVGEADGDVFVAMELVEGDTLKSWLGAARRSRREILDVLVAAGRGLAAAHGVGLVHRDFKPDNVLIGRDGRVRVADFGLARASAERDDVPGGEPSSSTPAGVTGERLLDSRVTRHDRIVGTPAYMAPEQFNGAPLDTQTDQYSFCVTVYEALVGTRPIATKRPDELEDRVVAGELDPRPPGVRLPRRLWKLLERGLSVDKNDRYPSMEALLDELSRDARRGRWRAVEAIAVVALAAVATGALLRGGESERSPCEGADAGLAEVWNDETRGAISASFDATGLAYSDASFARVRDLLEKRAEDWTRARREVCAATRIRGEQSEQMMDLRMQCLDDRLGEMQALTEVLAADVDAAVVDRSVEAVSRLNPLSYCDDLDALTAVVPPPADPEARARADELGAKLRTVSALRSAGKYDDASKGIEAVAADAEALGYQPLLAAALFERGRLQASTGDYTGAETTLLRSANVAAAAEDDRLVAHSLVELVGLFPRFGDRRAEARATIRMAEIAVARLGDELERAALIHLQGVAAANEGRLDEAREHLEAAYEIRAAQLGDDSVLVASTLNALGSVATRRGDFAAAVDAYERALAVAEAALGPDHPNVAITRGNLCFALSQQRRFEDARSCHQRVLETLERVHGTEHADVAWAINDYGLALLSEGDHAGAQREFERALAIWEATVGPDHPDAALTLVNLGEVAIEQKRYDAAIELCERSGAILDRAAPANDPSHIFHLACLGRAHLEAGEAARSVRDLERAVGLIPGGPLTPVEAAGVEFALSRALWARRSQRKRAVELAERARAAYAAGGAGFESQLAEVTAWLDGR